MGGPGVPLANLCSAHWIEPRWVELRQSRLQEGGGLKWFMRASVLAADLLVLVPAFLLFAFNRSYSMTMCVFVLLNPALLLVDHGHFQYNTLMLGLAVLGTVLLLDYKEPLLATVLVCASCCFKQMGLYFVPAFLVFLLRQCIRRRRHGLRLFLCLALAAAGATASFFAPFLRDFPRSLLPVLERIFPLHRGLYEDKVANFWWALATLTKFNAGVPPERLVRVCAGALLAALAPSLLGLLLTKPSGNRFLYALAYTTLCFYMFAFHVHEKSILVPQMAVLLLVHLSPIFVFWFSGLAALSLFQLLEKDGLQLYYLATLTVWLGVSQRLFRYMRFGWAWRVLVAATLAAAYALPLCQLLVAPPARYPHLFHVLALLGCAGGHGLSLAYLLYKQMTCESHYYYSRNSLQSLKL